MKITRAAAKALHYATPEIPGDDVIPDSSMVEADIAPETMERFREYQVEGETISDTIIRLCNLARLIRGIPDG